MVRVLDLTHLPGVGRVGRLERPLAEEGAVPCARRHPLLGPDAQVAQLDGGGRRQRVLRVQLLQEGPRRRHGRRRRDRGAARAAAPDAVALATSGADLAATCDAVSGPAGDGRKGRLMSNS